MDDLRNVSYGELVSRRNVINAALDANEAKPRTDAREEEWNELYDMLDDVCDEIERREVG